MTDFNCYPVFLGTELKNNYYKSEELCKHCLRPLLRDDGLRLAGKLLGCARYL